MISIVGVFITSINLYSMMTNEFTTNISIENGIVPSPVTSNSTPKVNSTSTSFIITPLPSNMALIHVGKTAGSTLSKNLRHGCYMFVPHPCRGSEDKNFGTKGGPGEESRISQLTKGYYHNYHQAPINVNSSIDEHEHDGYIISSRNPLDRVVSAFHYVHPENVAFTSTNRAKFLEGNKGKQNTFVEKFNEFFECFPTINALAHASVSSSDEDKDDNITTNTTECDSIGRFILSGGDDNTMKNILLNHFAFNYKYYASGLLAADRSRIFVLRQEHLVTDWINFNIRLGGEPHELSGTTNSFDKDKLAVKLPPGGLSKEEKRILCALLKEDIQVYLGIIDEADNLTEEEKEESRKEIRDDCN